MTSYKFTVASASETGNLTWNTNGTLSQLAITDGFNSGGTQKCNYGHDDLMRINSASCGSPWSQTFSYDPFGNISKSGSISWQPAYTNTINQYQSGWSGVSYDANGNLKYDTFNTYTWNPDRTLATANPGSAAANCGATGSCLTYDALARQVEVNTNGSYSQTLYSPIGKLALMNGQTGTKVMYPMPGGGTLISSSTNWPHYQHPDWLGTARLQTEFASAGLGQGPDVVDYDRSFAPYGEEYNNFGSDAYNLNFTGDIRTMGSSGLFDTENRELHSNQGRWISPDPAGLAAADPSNPQTWNRYAYGTNNPLSHRDPLGLFIVDCVWNDCNGGGGRGGGGGGGGYVDGVLQTTYNTSGLGGNGMEACPGPCSGSAWINDSNGGHWQSEQYWAFANGGGGYYAYTGPGALYYSAQQAGTAAALYMEQASIDQHREYGGTVYEDANEVFSYTQPQAGPPCGSGGCEIVVNLAVPSGTRLVGDYHTHPDLPGGNNFSTTDINGLIDNKIYGFLGTAPYGRVLMFNPNLYGPFMGGVPGAPPPVCVLQGPLFGAGACH